MSPSDDFFMQLSIVLQQMARSPDNLPDIPVKRWPVESLERRVLADLQAMVAALRTGSQQQSPRTGAIEGRYHEIFDLASDGLILHDFESGLIVEANPAACRMYGYVRNEFIGQTFTSITDPDSTSTFSKYVQGVDSQGRFLSEQVHTRQDGSRFHVELNGSRFLDQERVCVLSVIRDIGHRVHTEQQLQKRMEARSREQSILLDISQTLASALELQPGLILDQMRVIIDYTHAALFELTDSTLTTLAVRGPQILEQEFGFNIKLDDLSILETLFKGKKPTRIADVQGPDPTAIFLRSLLNDQAGILLQGIRSWMWVPLAIKGEIIGAIGVAHTRQNSFTAHDANLALTVANQAAITMVNAELYENAGALAALLERQRLARDLHDAVNQSLFSAGLIAEVLPRLWIRDPADGERSLEDLRRLMRGAQADMRLLLAELRPSTLTEAELGDLLHLLGAALAGRTSLPIHINITGEGQLPDDVKIALYRLCQEGLNNIAKHAEASHVEVQLHYQSGDVELNIRDDGRGFDLQLAHPGHYGLGMMQERATAAGATLTILSQPGEGTEIIVHWAEAR